MYENINIKRFQAYEYYRNIIISNTFIIFTLHWLKFDFIIFTRL